MTFTVRTSCAASAYMSLCLWWKSRTACHSWEQQMYQWKEIQCFVFIGCVEESNRKKKVLLFFKSRFPLSQVLSHSWKKEKEKKGKVHFYKQRYILLQIKEKGNPLLGECFLYISVYDSQNLTTMCEVKYYNSLHLHTCE